MTAGPRAGLARAQVRQDCIPGWCGAAQSQACPVAGPGCMRAGCDSAHGAGGAGVRGTQPCSMHRTTRYGLHADGLAGVAGSRVMAGVGHAWSMRCDRPGASQVSLALGQVASVVWLHGSDSRCRALGRPRGAIVRCGVMGRCVMLLARTAGQQAPGCVRGGWAAQWPHKPSCGSMQA